MNEDIEESCRIAFFNFAGDVKLQCIVRYSIHLVGDLGNSKIIPFGQIGKAAGHWMRKWEILLSSLPKIWTNEMLEKGDGYIMFNQILQAKVGKLDLSKEKLLTPSPKIYI